MTALLPLPKPGTPVNLDEALAAACEGVAGITSAQFRALLSPEDIENIEAGDIPVMPTLHAFAQSFAEGGRAQGPHRGKAGDVHREHEGAP